MLCILFKCGIQLTVLCGVVLSLEVVYARYINRTSSIVLCESHKLTNSAHTQLDCDSLLTTKNKK